MNNETDSETSTVVPEMTYDEKMAFLIKIRTEIGLENKMEDDHTDAAPPGKYVTEYTFGTI
tara:strand:- start:588 stop:770 length:183 start_codon:yes stop_codon:yes gene_type:complete